MFKLLFGHRPEFVTEILELLCQDIIIPASPIIECPVTPKVFPLFWINNKIFYVSKVDSINIKFPSYYKKN